MVAYSSLLLPRRHTGGTAEMADRQARHKAGPYRRHPHDGRPVRSYHCIPGFPGSPVSTRLFRITYGEIPCAVPLLPAERFGLDHHGALSALLPSPAPSGTAWGLWPPASFSFSVFSGITAWRGGSAWPSPSWRSSFPHRQEGFAAAIWGRSAKEGIDPDVSRGTTILFNDLAVLHHYRDCGHLAGWSSL